MKKRMNQFVAIALMISLIITFGCEKEEKDKAPQLPPIATFLNEDLSSLLNNNTTKKTTEEADYFGTALGTVLIMNSVLVTGLAIPVAAYAIAVDQTPVRVDNDTWEWSFDVEDGETTYTAVLTADVIGEEVNWEMKISGGEYTDFVWFTGSCDILRTSGNWTLYMNTVEHQEVLTIDWNHDWEKETFDVTYTFVLSGHPYEGSYVEYGINDNTDYNAYYTFVDMAQDFSYYIYYNLDTHVGKILEYNLEDLVNPALEGCWDESLQNVNCPGVE